MNDLKPGYRVGVPLPDDTPIDIETRERMWARITAQLPRETWGQWVRRMIRKGLR